MYVGLILTPWMLMYALSTIVMNHRAAFKEHYGGQLVQWNKEKEQLLPAKFSPGTPPAEMAAAIMRELNLAGNFSANMGGGGKKLTILRTDPITPRRVTYTPADGRLIVERQEFRSQPFLESLHRRRGFQGKVVLDDAWAACVDIAIVAMVFWAASGLWMWWELKVTRRTGALFGLSGLALFLLFIFSI
jgi:hypothetical protein